MIKSVDRLAWFYYEANEAVAVTIYNPCTDHNKFMLIVEEATETGPLIQIHYLPKVLVVAAFGIEFDEIRPEHHVTDYKGYDVPIPQVLFDWKSDTYFIGTLERLPSDQFVHDAPHTTRYVSRQAAVDDYLSDKNISFLIGLIKKTIELSPITYT